MATVRKSEAALAKYERAGLTEDGKNWIKMVVDPFHDLPILPIGPPDTITADAVSLLVKSEATITRPSTVPEGSNWDCSIFLDQILNTYDATYGRFVDYGQAVNDVSALLPLGGVNYISGAAGAKLAPWDPAVTTSSLSYGHIPLADDYIRGPFRLVAVGFEVYNTTADLYKQGTVVTWRLPRAFERQDVLIQYNSASLLSNVYPAPPGSINSAKVITNSQQWDAKEGCYVVGAIDGPMGVQRTLRKFIVRTDTYDHAMFESTTNNEITGGWMANGVIANSYDPANGTGIHQAVYPERVALHDFASCGAYFAGLSSQTSLTLCVNYYIERLPTLDLSDLIPLAHPRPRYDPIALEIYSRIITEMPTGVRVKDNGLGKWFAEAVSAVAPVLSGSLSALPHPLAQGAAMALKMAGKAADNYLVSAQGSGDGKARALKAKTTRKKAKAAAKQAAGKRAKGRGKPPPLPPRD